MSSDSDHDAYLERMKQEGEDRDSEDGTSTPRGRITLLLFTWFMCLFTDDVDYVAAGSGSDVDLE